VLIQKLKQFQDFGHRDLRDRGFYRDGGNPSGVSETRKPLSREASKKPETYKQQVLNPG
jgi:hypothetical protein